MGPASGPQTQMAQNLVLSWLAGSRIIELKTVQINDELEIGRPCIDAANVGYNIEWSQELKVEQSLDQYVQGAMLIHMLRTAPEAFAEPLVDSGLDGVLANPSMTCRSVTIYKVSSRRRSATSSADLIDATESVNRLARSDSSAAVELKDLDYPTALSRSITLSTFHGCPADEIERICEFLITELGRRRDREDESSHAGQGATGASAPRRDGLRTK